jgi:hypothetical protein
MRQGLARVREGDPRVLEEERVSGRGGCPPHRTLHAKHDEEVPLVYSLRHMYHK